MDTVAVSNGDDLYLDPPVRLLPQWDSRWGKTRIAGPKTSQHVLTWTENGCNASSAAMVLRWFAEDCPMGKISFPTKEESAVHPDWYGPRMGEAFWPNADPPGKVELDVNGRIHYRKLYDVAAHYLKTGEINRTATGGVEAMPPNAHYVAKRPAEGWMDLLRRMLETGPVIVGIGAPAGHFVVSHGIVSGGLLIADPGNVLHQAHRGGANGIEDWRGKDGYMDGTMDPEAVRMPATGQWPEGQAPGQEGDPRGYHLITGDFLDALLQNLRSLTSLSYPEGAMLAG